MGISDEFFFGQPPFDLNEEEREKLQKLHWGILLKEAEKMAFLRTLAIKNGEAAKKLEDLKSENGEPFKEVESADYKRAEAQGTDRKFPPETAYLCCSEYEDYEKTSDTCGWVKGNPIRGQYNNIGFLSGSAGVCFCCKICGKKIAEKPFMFS